MENLPIGIQNFEEVRTGKYLYVDKTKSIAALIGSGKYFFISRPRRFGKSLTLSTISAIYEGKKALFEGLWIERNHNWSKQNPVLHFQFNRLPYKEKGLQTALQNELISLATEQGIRLEQGAVSEMFYDLVKKIHQKRGKVVILIDEYDKPIIDFLDEEGFAKAKNNQEILKNFYSIIKSSDAFIEFLLITGVSRFSHVSIFSDLNNLNDLSIHPDFSDLMGYSQSEIENNFGLHIRKAAAILTEKNEVKLLQQIKEWYNGYSWDAKNYVYNPFSILNFFSQNQFQNFWFRTGTPTFLLHFFKKEKIYKVENLEVSRIIFDSYDLDAMDLRALLFQTGYLTIKKVDEFGLVTLGYPNREVEEAMYSHLLSTYNQQYPADSIRPVLQLREAFLKNDLSQVGQILNSLFKAIPSIQFAQQNEFLYHAIVHIVFKYLGVFIESEVHTSDGRIDAVVKTPQFIYLLEFKLDQSAEAALTQIIEKGYAQKYALDGKSIIGMGINFSSITKGIEKILVEAL